MNTRTKYTNKKIIESGFGSLKGMRSFTKEDEFDSCIDKLFSKKEFKRNKINFSEN